MQGSDRRTHHLLLSATLLSLLCLTPVDAQRSTLVRLSINWLPTDRLDAFEAMYDRELEPILARHGFETTEKWSRRDSVHSIFSSHFAVESPAVAIAQMRALREDPAWRDGMQQLGAAVYGEPDHALEYHLHIQNTPAGAGKSVQAGAGKSIPVRKGSILQVGSGFGQGLWQNFGLVDGMPHTIADMLQDRNGDLWFATYAPGPNLGWPGGLWRYDGFQLCRFTTADGLPHDAVTCLLEDRKGQLWVGSKGGLTRYDGRQDVGRQDVGETFTTFDTTDGLPHNTVICLLEDREGQLWVGSEGGLTRYDDRQDVGETFTTFTTEDGMAHNRVACLLEDRKGQLWFGAGWNAGGPVGLGRYDGQNFTQFTTADGLTSDWILSLLEDESGQLWIGTNGSVNRYDDRQDVGETFERVSKTDFRQYLGGVMAMLQDRTGDLFFAIWGEGLRRYDGTSYLSLTPQDGLASTGVLSLLEDRDGQLWVGTAHGELSRYKGQRLATFGSEDGLTHDNISSLLEDREGRLWVGTPGGVSWYDTRQDAGERFAVLETPEKAVNKIWQDRRGHLWFSLAGIGAGRYDGQSFERFDKKGIRHAAAMRPLLEDRRGRLWFATGGESGGIDLFDGERWTTFDDSIGLAHSDVSCMHQDRAGHLWFGSWNGGVRRYDGEQFKWFTTKDGLAKDEVFDILEDSEGRLWFATSGGVSCYDGRTFANLTAKDGLTYDNVNSMMQDRAGHLWFATRGGVSRYDGLVFQHLTRKDGLANDSICEIVQDRHGAVWIATSAGLNRYLPSSNPPAVRLQSIVADQRYQPTAKIEIPAPQKLVSFEFRGSSLTTSAERMAYVYRLEGYNSEWTPVYTGRVEYEDLPVGKYTFQVKAVDQDLNYSAPARVQIAISPPYTQWALAVGLGLALVGLVAASGYALKKRREQRRAEQALMQELEDELQTAHQLQMSLMPETTPDIPGLDIAGRCLPVNHVCGDFFQYFVRNGTLSICMADVTGHAMEAAVPVMMFSGVLETEMRLAHPLDELFGHLNQTLHHKLDRRTYICFTMGELQIRDSHNGSASLDLRLANCGCPYPYHYQAAGREVAELSMDAYPLGIRPNTEYQVVETQLSPGDYLVFCSDGIIEAANSQEEIFGFEQTTETIRKSCREGQSAEGLIDHLLTQVKAFTEEGPQGDDMTVVVLKVEA